jgi:uncharacterized repeat protein (TIGR03837 family)
LWTIQRVSTLRWDIYCKVIDNYGDIGVCWRLCADLAQRDQQVRLWLDDATPLAWMAPQGCAGVQVLDWSVDTLSRLQALPPAEVLIEAFGCELEPERVAHCARSPKPPVWINLEYLSAEAWVQRCHGLPSPVLQGPGKGLSKHFYYPGFTPGTGGLLREADLAQRQAEFDRDTWLAQQGLQPGAQVISLFCYEPQALGEWLQRLAAGPQRTKLLVTAGRARTAVDKALPRLGVPSGRQFGAVDITRLEHMSQRDYDHLLWACDLNFVRGEDSLVRALWAGKPFVWSIYPQADLAHHAKLDAFLDWLQAPASLRQFHRVWNGLSDCPLPAADLPAWTETVLAARRRLQQQPDLSEQLLLFVEKNR